MIQKETKIYAHHGMDLTCDIYTRDKTPTDAPVFLYFHPGGLVGWGRDVIPPWLVQMCLHRNWPLISPSYRLLPQTGAGGLVEDAKAAYAFARNWNTQPGTSRRVIVGGASGGVFMATLVSRYCEPTPLAYLSISGINSFRHSFFNSSTLLTPEPIPDSDMAHAISGPICVGITPKNLAKRFEMDKLLANGSENPNFTAQKEEQLPEDELNDQRGMLYDYYTYKNSWKDLVGSVDDGFDWQESDADVERRQGWPQTIIFHGNDDYDVPHGVSEQMRDRIGADKVDLFIAEGQGHLFEGERYVEDKAPCMDAVHKSIARLDEIVASQ